MSGDLLTIGMATRGEPDLLWATLSALAEYHPRVRYVVVDNAPERDPRNEAITRAVGGDYYHRPDRTGTAAPRDAVFRAAATEWVACIDAHVLLRPGAVRAMLDYAAAHPGSRDIVSGPVIGDDGQWYATSWTRADPPALWGTWHADPRGLDPAGAPFEIHAMGLGLWFMRRAAWPGFHPLFRGFGGEEGYIHELVRRRGGRALCHPAVAWRHKFRDVSGWHNNPPPPYPLNATDHVWNLLVGNRELGIAADDKVRAHHGKHLTDAAWAELAAAADAAQPFGGPRAAPRPHRLLAVWYTDNTAPPALLAKSAESVRQAARQAARHDVTVASCAWAPDRVPGGPPGLAVAYSGPRVRSHLTIVRQIEQAVGAARAGGAEFDAVCFCEHDVLYPPGYFDRVGDALAAHPAAPVVSHLDYIGLNATGWQKVRARHEPLHQLCLRWPVFVANLSRAAVEGANGRSVVLEPDAAPDPHPEYARVDPGLWVGAQVAEPPAEVRAVLSVMGVDDGGAADRYATDPRYEYAHRPISDDGSKPAPGLPWLADQVAWITARVDAGTPVYLHCLGGVSRSGLVAVAYIMARHGVTRDAALQYVRGARAQIAPRAAFWDLLAEYEAALPGPLAGAVRAPDPRADWCRLTPSDPTGLTGTPSVHVNHDGGGGARRLTAHGEVCYDPVGAALWHPHWGEAKSAWPGAMTTVATVPVAFKGAGGCGCEAEKHPSIEGWYAAVKGQPSDFNEHVDTLRALAGTVRRCTEISTWHKVADVAMVAGLPADGTFTSVCPRPKPQWPHLKAQLGDRFVAVAVDPGTAPAVAETDLLFIDTEHTAVALLPLLLRHRERVTSYIVVHCTETYGEAGDRPDAPGVMHALREFCRGAPEWGVIRRDRNNHGLVVLSRRPEDRPELPGLWKRATSFTKAMFRHAANGLKIVPVEVLAARQDECAVCEFRALDRCSACGCPLEDKLPLASERCGLVKLHADGKALDRPLRWDAHPDPKGGAK